MGRSHTLRFGAVLAVGAAAAVSMAATASAKVIFDETFHDEETELVEDFCGISGLTVEFAIVTDGRVKAVAHGRDGLAYFNAHIEETSTATNVENGNSATAVLRVVDKDLRVTDNGDGTLTILILTAGNRVLYDEDGNVLARDPGQERIESSSITAARRAIRPTTSSSSSSASPRSQRAGTTTSAKLRSRSSPEYEVSGRAETTARPHALGSSAALRLRRSPLGSARTAAPRSHAVSPRPLPSAGWSFELQWDGFRAIGSTEDGFSVRSRRPVTARNAQRSTRTVRSKTSSSSRRLRSTGLPSLRSEARSF
jgi:hypothetical protein